MAAKIRKGDRVMVLAGKDKGKQGRILRIFTDTNTVLVEGINKVKRHEKVRPGQGRAGTEGGIISKESPIDVSSVALVCGTCGKGRAGFEIQEDGSKIRVCRKCGDQLQ